ncbi:OLC1v1013649C1 [Oldenlandia corymbosa var. corymbosa]|nr:OLC1v1013649C1 [Oldenlandia corymbosa var. corymbosa]
MCYIFRSALLEPRIWNSLKELILIRVLVSGGTPESFFVHHSGDLTSSEVRRPSLALQCSGINFFLLDTLIMSFVTLISLKIGVPRELLLENVPRLIHIGILFNGYSVEDVIRRLLHCFSKLRVLSLCLHPKQTREVTHLPCTTKQHVHEDRISQLPDEMLCRVLSFLTLTEAGRTSVLSKRWKNVWTYTDDLEFDALSTSFEMLTVDEYVDEILRGRPKFVNLVNKVLQTHRTLVLNKFTIHCALDDSFQAELNKWLQYAFDKRVQKLEVNVSDTAQFVPGIYIFSCALLEQRGWNSLKELMLARVSVSGATLEFLLRDCKYLESLVVHYSKVLTTLQVCRPSLALQNLEIHFCPLKSLTVSNVNLISLKIATPRTVVIKNNVPKLAHIEILSTFYTLEDFGRFLSNSFSKLEVLTLILDSWLAREFDRKLPQLLALKQLSLRLFLYEEGLSISGLSSFFRASPNLEKCSIEMMYPFTITTPGRLEDDFVNCTVPHLRVVEISGYRGHSIEMELVNYFLENAISLRKMIVDSRYKSPTFGTCEKHWFYGPKDCSRIAEISNEGRRCAEQQLLGITMPSHVTLQIL